MPTPQASAQRKAEILRYLEEGDGGLTAQDAREVLEVLGRILNTQQGVKSQVQGLEMKLSEEKKVELICTLLERFDLHPERHRGTDKQRVEERLSNASEEKLWSLYQLEMIGGYPDVIEFDKSTGEAVIYTCSGEVPDGTRNCAYDREAEEMIREGDPEIDPSGNALDQAESMGVNLLTGMQYQHLQTLGRFDQKSVSWLQTDEDIRSSGGALYGMRRGGVYVNVGTDTAGGGDRGFRASLKI